MKKCEHFKDLILTDYIDGELDKNSALSLEDHLSGCGECRVFLKEVKDNAAMPLKRTLQEPVPAVLWEGIKQNIENKNQEAEPLADLIAGLKGWFVFPRLVPVFASLFVMLLAGSAVLNTIHIQQAKDKEQGEYLVSMLSPKDISAQADNNDGATPIEHYFL